MGVIAERLAQLDKSSVFSKTPPFPKVLMLEPSSACNLRCSFCRSHRHKRKTMLIAPDLAKSIMRDAFAGGAREIGLYLRGESFLHPNLERIVGDASETGYAYIYITTNGLLATKEKLAALVDCGVHSLKFSINAADAQSYAAVHGFDGFETVMKNLRDAISLRDRSIASGKPFHRVMVSCVYAGELTDGLVSFKESLHGIVDDFILEPSLEYNGDIGKCTMIFNRAHVTAEGYLTFCCQDFGNALVYADLNRENIVDAWTGAAAAAFRERFMTGELDGTLCGQCLYGCQKPVKALEYADKHEL